VRFILLVRISSRAEGVTPTFTIPLGWDGGSTELGRGEEGWAKTGW